MSTHIGWPDPTAVSVTGVTVCILWVARQEVCKMWAWQCALRPVAGWSDRAQTLRRRCGLGAPRAHDRAHGPGSRPGRAPAVRSRRWAASARGVHGPVPAEALHYGHGLDA